jgi:aldehyde oxidoreductase
MNVERQTLTLVVNGEERTVAAPPARRLSEMLREDLGLKGTKVGCNAGDCGACTVLVDGAPVCSCLMPARQAAGRSVTTVEGIGDGRLANLQAAFLRHGAAQCGICTPGMLMAATSLLRENPRPTRPEVEDAIGGVLCRCTGYQKIVDAVLDATHPGEVPVLPGAGHAVGARIERLDGVPKVSGPTARSGCAPYARPTMMRPFPSATWTPGGATPPASNRSSPPPTSKATTVSASSRPSPSNRRWRKAVRDSGAKR